MDKTLRLFALPLTAILFAGCASHFRIESVERNRIVIDSRYDGTPDAAAADFIAPYKNTVDSIMSPVVGRVARSMNARRPEGLLSNVLSDILIWAGDAYNEQPAFSVYNMGGIRAALSEGDVTVGDVIDIAPFENKICFLTLTGEDVMELFRQIAAVGGEGVSHGVELAITKEGKLVSALLNGREIDPNAKYRVATIDYLAQGNDRMAAFKKGTDVNSPKTEENNTRFIIMDYFKEQMKQGRVVDAKIEGRIKKVQQ